MHKTQLVIALVAAVGLLSGVAIPSVISLSPSRPQAGEQMPSTLSSDGKECLAKLDHLVKSMIDGGRNAALCFAEGTSPEVVAAFYAAHPELAAPSEEVGPRYQLGTRWSGSQGDPRALTWSFVPDGLAVDTGTSTLFASMDSKFGGNRALWISQFQSCFNRWQALSGVTYTRVKDSSNHDWDDGATWGSSSGTYRGDIRIAMIPIDGAYNVLGYTYYPSNGDTVLDSAESWQTSANSYRYLRNTFMHEHGHGIGIAHICPIANLWLMEPYLSTSWDGPQHDDIRAVQRYYGDPYEPNNSAAQAYDLGNLPHGTHVQLGPTPSPSVTNGSVLSIDADGETDWFKFTVSYGGKITTASVTPKGLTYDSSTQAQDGNCNSGNNINSLTMANLNFQVIGTDGVTVLATAAAQPAGSTETLTEVNLSGSPGTFYIKVYEGDSPTQSQLYWLDVTVANTTADVTPPSPDPPSWVTQPTAISTSSITMEAYATDPSGVEYYYANTGISSHPRAYSTDPVYTDTGLDANRSVTYKVKARDQSPQLNETTYTTPVGVSTWIETPTGLTFGTTTDTSIQVTALDTFTRVNENSSGLYFEVTTTGGSPVGGAEANTWLQPSSAPYTITATGLSPGTQYRFRAKARNNYAVETPWYPSPGYATHSTTGGATCSLLGDMNLDGRIDGLDIAGFVRAKLGSPPIGEENQACADYPGSLTQAIAAFTADLLGL